MEVRVLSIKEAKEKVKQNNNTDYIKFIIATSYDNDIEEISETNKIILKFDDITNQNKNSFNADLAKKIHNFIAEINFEKYQLYICCDSGISRSSAIAAAIFRKYNEDENMIWEDHNFKPNLLVYEMLCNEFGLKNTSIELKRKEKINIKALRKQINKVRKLRTILPKRDI